MTSSTTSDRARGARPAPAATGGKGGKRRRKRREWPYRLSVTILVLASLAVTLFPVAGTYYNNWRTLQSANRGIYDQSQSHDTARWLAMAREYNATLAPGAASDPWSGKDQTRSPQYKDYLRQLSANDVMARLRIPRIHVTLPVRHGTSDQVLDQGGGHMYGTSLPVGGKGTNVGIAAHRGLPTMTAFDNLPSLTPGDDFFIDVYGEVLAYRVTRVVTVLPTDTRPLARDKVKDQVTMITCTPYGINSHRLLVTGDRIQLSQANQGDLNWHQKFDWSIQPWMRMRLAIAALALLLLIGLAIKWIHDDRKRARRREALLAKRAAQLKEATEAQAAAAAACTCGAWDHTQAEHGAHEGSTGEHGDDGGKADEKGADERRTGEHGADEHGADEHGADEHGVDEHGADEHHPGRD